MANKTWSPKASFIEMDEIELLEVLTSRNWQSHHINVFTRPMKELNDIHFPQTFWPYIFTQSVADCWTFALGKIAIQTSACKSFGRINIPSPPFPKPPFAPPLPSLTVVHEYGWQASLAWIIIVPQVHINHINIKSSNNLKVRVKNYEAWEVCYLGEVYRYHNDKTTNDL